MLEAVCPNGHRLQIPPEHAGMKLRCPAPGCGAVFQLAGAPAGGAPQPTAGASGLNLAPASTPAPQPAASAPPPMNNPPPQPAADPQGGRWTGSDPAQAAAGGLGQAPRVNVNPLRNNSLSGASMKNGAQLALMVGLMLVLTARGCQSLSLMWISRADANLQLEKNEFDNDYRDAMQEKQDLLEDKDTKESEKTKIRKEMDDLTTDHNDEKKKVEKEWAETAKENQASRLGQVGWSFWREVLFFIGTIVFVAGLLVMTFTGVGVERYLCFGMLAIVVFSIYVGGFAWAASIASTVKGL